MFALIAAVLMVIGIFVVPLHHTQWEFWLSWALVAFFVHVAFATPYFWPQSPPARRR